MPTLDLLCFPPDPWNCPDPHRRAELLYRLSTRYRVVALESFSGDEPPRRMRALLRATIAAWQGRGSPLCAALSPNLHTLDLSHGPRSAAAPLDPYVTVRQAFYVLVHAHTLDFRPALLWVENPWAAVFLDWFPGVPVVCHVAEPWPAAPWTGHRALWCALEQRLVADARLVLCASRSLYAGLSLRRRGGVVHLPPGFDPAPYRAAAAAAARRPACPHASAASRLLAGVPRPIAGYFGPLASYADPATLAACARALPEVSFVLAVPESAGRFRCLAGLPNVHIRGRVPPEDLPGLLGAFDAALLPLRRSAWVAPAHPPQLLPYLATGRPIVATPVAEVRALAGRLVRLARTRADFVAALRAALADCDPRAAAARQAVAARYTWDVWLDRLAPLLAGVAAVPGVDLVPEYVRRFRALYVFDALERHEFATAGSSDEPAGAAAADTDSVEAPRVLHLSGFPGLPNVPGGSGPVDVGEFTRPSLLETASLLQLCGFTAPSAQPAGDGR